MDTFKVELPTHLSDREKAALSSAVAAAVSVLIESDIDDGEFQVISTSLPEACASVAAQVLEHWLAGDPVKVIRSEQIDYDTAYLDDASAKGADKHFNAAVAEVEEEIESAFPDGSDSALRGLYFAINSIGDPDDEGQIEELLSLIEKALETGPKFVEVARAACHRHGIPFASSYRAWRQQNPEAPATAAARIFFLDSHRVAPDLESLVDRYLLRTLSYGGHSDALVKLRGFLSDVPGEEARELEQSCRQAERAALWISRQLSELTTRSMTRKDLMSAAKAAGVDAPTVWLSQTISNGGLIEYSENGTRYITADRSVARQHAKRTGHLKQFEITPGVELPTDLLDSPVSALPLHKAAANVLVKTGISTVGELLSLTEIQLLRKPHVGRKTILLVKECLAKEGLVLGSHIADAG